WIATQARQHRGELLLHARHLLTRGGEAVARLVVIGLRGDAAADQLLLPVELALLVVEGILRRGELGLALAVAGAQGLDLQARAGELRLGLLHSGAERTLIEADQSLACRDMLVV